MTDTVKLRHGLSATYITHAQIAAQKRTQARNKVRDTEVKQ
jgi:hypothetical protein